MGSPTSSMLPSDRDSTDPVPSGDAPSAPEPFDPTAAPMAADTSDPVADRLVVPTAPIRPAGGGSSGRTVIIAFATALVSILAGITLFVSGFLVGQRFVEQPG